MKKGSMHGEPCREILEEAAAWFVEFRDIDGDGGADALTQRNFDVWLRRSPENIRAYLEIAGTWADLPAAQAGAPIDTAALMAAARDCAKVVSLAPLDRSRSLVRSAKRPRLAAAAGVLLACGAAFLAWSQRNVSYETGIGEQRFVTLADGSTVVLNARSRMAVRFDEGGRHIELLAGQALFDVAADSRRPFVVTSGETRVRAVGTQFDVYKKRTGTVVTVVEGRVAISSPAIEQKNPLISAGEQVTVTPDAIRAPAAVDIAAATAWTQRRLVFNATRLADVAEEFNRYNPRPLIVEDEALGQIHISGIYSSTDPASLLGFLRLQPGVSVAETEQDIRVSLK